MRTALIALALAALPLAASAEGARMGFACEAEDGSTTSITIAPQGLDADGKGEIRVIRDGREMQGTAASYSGPFRFGTDSESSVLFLEEVVADGWFKLWLHRVELAGDTTHPLKTTLTSYLCETDF